MIILSGRIAPPKFRIILPAVHGPQGRSVDSVEDIPSIYLLSQGKKKAALPESFLADVVSLDWLTRYILLSREEGF